MYLGRKTLQKNESAGTFVFLLWLNKKETVLKIIRQFLLH